MKLSIISASALAMGALASEAQLNPREIEALVARSLIDPKYLDPTRLSVLSILKTAIPSGSAFPQPTGDFEPDWYKSLPANVKSLLPKLYSAPAPSPSANVAVLASTTSNVSVTTARTRALAASSTFAGATSSPQSAPLLIDC
jgi:hypothetical protein